MRNRLTSPQDHVHGKNFRKSSSKTPQGRSRSERSLLRPTVSVKTRAPWIPPGKSTEHSFRWESPTHRLEIVPPLGHSEVEPSSSSALRLAELSVGGEEEEGLNRRIVQYERKIDDMLTEVNTMKSQMERQRRQQVLERHWDQLSVSQRVIADQEEELAEVTKELQKTERENNLLRHSMEVLVDSDHHRLETDRAHQDKDSLLRKLTEAEADGAAAAKHICALRDAMSSLCCATRPSAAEVSVLAHQKDLLLDKLETFEATNQALRHLLREHHGNKVDSMRRLEQKDLLLKRLMDTEAENSRLVMKLEVKEDEVYQLCRRLDSEKDGMRNTTDWTRSLESTRAHLQGQLRSKEAENNRLTVQIRNLERAAEQQRTQLERLREQLSRQRLQAGTERDALKKSSRTQRQQAEQAQQLNSQLIHMEKRMSDALASAERWQNHHGELVKEKNQLELRVSLMNSRVMELKEQLQNSQDQSCLERQALLDRLQGLNTEGASARVENKTLKASVSVMDDKLSRTQSELLQVKSSIKQYESLLQSYKIQVEKTRSEADEYAALLAQAERTTLAARDSLERGVEQENRELKKRLLSLEELPDALMRAELQLHHAQERERHQERLSSELNTTIMELQRKVEHQGTQLDVCRQKNIVLLDENRKLQQSFQSAMKESTAQNQDLIEVISKRKQAVHGNQLLLEQKTQECVLLKRKLDEAMDHARRQVTDTRDRSIAHDLSAQTKILELETQLSRCNSQISQLRLSKEEVERRHQSQLQDLRDRLEQSDNTNQSLQSYVHFLRETYADEFGDVMLHSSPQTHSPLSSRP